MKLPKFALFVLLISAISLCYVYQQVQITILAYQHTNNNKVYQELLDRNISLRYNLEKTKSISSLGNKVLTDNVNFEIPRNTQLAQIFIPVKNETNMAKVFPKETIISQIFGARKEVEAKTIK